MAATKRLEYIDAMRGFTMLLVVFSHVILMGYSEPEMPSYNFAFVQFRMPLFFFISGFVLYKAERVWDYATSMAFIRKKFLVQIVPALVFLAIFTYLWDVNLFDSLFDKFKAGYWFTISLFEYFLLYVVACFVAGRWPQARFLAPLLFVVEFLAIAGLLAMPLQRMPEWVSGAAGFIGTPKLMYYPFFCFGIAVKRFFSVFCSITDNAACMAVILALFFCCLLCWDSLTAIGVAMTNGAFEQMVQMVLRLITGTLGIIVVFTFFRKKEALFTQGTFVGRSLQYIGRRTLDVYLLHYFFLPYNLRSLGSFFRDNSNPSLEFFCTLSVAVLVVALSLCMSNILRLSPLLEQYLFGVKAKK